MIFARAVGACVAFSSVGLVGCGGDVHAGPTTTRLGGDADAAASPTACWAARLPAEVQPIRPTLSTVTACEAASVDPGSNPSNWGSDDDARALLVGRWTNCGSSSPLSALEHAGIEFGANGRWRLLDLDASAASIPKSSAVPGATGRYFALASGQLDLLDDGIEGRRRALFLRFAANMNVVRMEPGEALQRPANFARAEPSPLNGRDNPPSLTDGTCSMVGTWDVTAHEATAPAATLAFDALGNFVGGPLGTDLCASNTMYGTYSLFPGFFALTTNIGMGQCHWWYDAAYPATFDATCGSVTLVQAYDNCTGGRGYLNGQTTLTRRR